MPSHSTSFSSSKFNLTSLLEEVQITNSVHNDLNQVIANINSTDQNRVSLNNLQQQPQNSNQINQNRMRPRSKEVVVVVVSPSFFKNTQKIVFI